jgi:hypothetical protein
MFAMDNRPALRGAAIRALAARPETFSRLLAVHVGALAPFAVLPDALRLAWSMLSLGPRRFETPLEGAYAGKS